MHLTLGQPLPGPIAHHHVIDASGEALAIDRDQSIGPADREDAVIHQGPYPVIYPDTTLTTRPRSVVIRPSLGEG
jgi:hypothetical protein